MSDNFTYTPGTGETGAADDIGGVKFPRVKLIHGADGTNDGDVSDANPLPIDDAGGSITVDGTVTAELSAPDNAVLDTIDAVLDTINAKLVTGTDIGDVTINNSTGAAAVNIQDGGNTITVDGTVTANLSATDNAVLDTIDAVLDTIKTDTAALVVDAAASEVLLGTIDADTGAMVTDLAAIEVLLGTIDADTGAIKTAVEVIDNAISGSEMQVDVVAALPAGTNVIGEVIPSTYPTTDNAKFMKKYYTSAGAATDGIIWSPAAGTRWYVTDLIINVSAAATVTLEDDLTAGDSPVLKCELAANGGFCKRFQTPLASGEDAADLIITTTAGNVYVTACGYEV
jgi:hypothetical protein